MDQATPKHLNLWCFISAFILLVFFFFIGTGSNSRWFPPLLLQPSTTAHWLKRLGRYHPVPWQQDGECRWNTDDYERIRKTLSIEPSQQFFVANTLLGVHAMKCLQVYAASHCLGGLKKIHRLLCIQVGSCRWQSALAERREQYRNIGKGIVPIESFTIQTIHLNGVCLASIVTPISVNC